MMSGPRSFCTFIANSGVSWIVAPSTIDLNVTPVSSTVLVSARL